MHGSVFLGKDGQVIRPAILWNDQRTRLECEEIQNRVGREEVRRITCNPPLTGFQGPKVLWLRNNEPEAFAITESVLLPKDYLRFMLSGSKATEVSDASGTGFFDVPRRSWSREILEALGLDAKLFPSAHESSVISAHTRSVPGLSDGVPIVGGGGDQAAAAVGTGAVEPGIVSVSLGTSGVVFTSIGSPDFDPGGAAHTFCHANGGWHAMGVMLSCGGALQWYRDTLCPSASFEELAQEAAESSIGANGATFLPYLTGERCPHNDPLARASFSGLTLGHRRADLSRSVFEGITIGLKDGFDLLKGLGATVGELRVNGGGAKSEFWLRLLSDVFETRCATLEVDEGPAFGAAILAGVGVGVWPDVGTACRSVVRRKAEWTPSGASYEKVVEQYRRLYGSVREWNRLIAS
jgi:xylulokinase